MVSREEGKGMGKGGRRREMSYSLVLKCTNIILLRILLLLVECMFKLPFSIKCTFIVFLGYFEAKIVILGPKRHILTPEWGPDF